MTAVVASYLRPVNTGYNTYRGSTPQIHCVVFTNWPSNSRGVLTTTFFANPAIYLTNFEDRKIEAMLTRTRDVF